MCEKKAPTLPKALDAIMKVFDDYAAKDKQGPKDKLSKKELKELLQTEMGPTPETADEKKLNELFKLMDADRDGQVDFQEFMSALAIHHCVSHRRPCEMTMKCSKK